MPKSRFHLLSSYFVFAAFSTILDMALLFAFTEFFKIYYLLSVAIAYFAGMIANYSLNKAFTFENKSKKYAKQFGVFAFISLIGLGLNVLLIFLFVQFAGLHYLIAKIIAVFIVFAWSFTGHKKLTFSEKHFKD